MRAIGERHGAKRDLTLMDNNVVASPRFKEMMAEIRELGFCGRRHVCNARKSAWPRSVVWTSTRRRCAIPRQGPRWPAGTSDDLA